MPIRFTKTNKHFTNARKSRKYRPYFCQTYGCANFKINKESRLCSECIEKNKKT